MNYFKLYDIPVSFKPDLLLVKQKFYELSRKYHPDFFSNADAEQQAEVLEKSSMVNKAYKTFQNTDEIIKYILLQKGFLEEEEKYQLPADFLMEVMELNEQLMDAEMEDDTQKFADIQLQLSAKQNKIYEPVKKIIEHYEEGVSTEKELLQVKDYYYKKKYLNRILAKMV